MQLIALLFEKSTLVSNDRQLPNSVATLSFSDGPSYSSQRAASAFTMLGHFGFETDLDSGSSFQLYILRYLGVIKIFICRFSVITSLCRWIQYRKS